jgi:putative peptidoglycan lipid II flippase
MSSRGPEARPAADGWDPAGRGQRRDEPSERARGAHRANRGDGQPGAGRVRDRPSRDERGARGVSPRTRTGRPSNQGRAPRGPGVEAPFPGDVPSSGQAGLAGDGYGLSAEGELSEVEFIRARLTAIKAAAAAAAASTAASPSATRHAAEPAANASLVRSSAVMAAGTLASRLTGMLRTVVLVPALGAYALANAYNVANTLPNTVYNLAIGGILTSVIVPLLVSAAKRDADRGETYSQRMFTLVTVILAVVTIVATAAGGPIATLFGCASKACAGSPAAADYRHVLVIFSYFFIPQIFFYGISSLAGAVLNARGHFAAPMWTPVINNIVVIIVTVAFMVISGVFSGVHPSVTTITPMEVKLLGIGTTLGIVAQSLALIPALRRVGFMWRPRFDFRRADISEIGRMAGWMFGYIVTTQVAFFVTVKVADHANIPGQTQGVGAGYTAYASAWMLFQLPYAIVAISVITALLPRMSANASDRRYDLVRSDFSTGVRLGSVIVAPAALVLAVLGPALAVVMFGWGNTNLVSASYFGIVFSVFSLGLVPYMLFQLLLRVFYSLHDSRTPALVGVATMVTNVAANLIALAVVPRQDVVAALGIGFGLANVVGSVMAWRILSRRLGGLAGRQIGSSLIKMHAAALPAALLALLVAAGVHAVFGTGKVSAFVTLVAGGVVAVAVYLVSARLLKVTEVADLTGMVRSRLRR